LCSAVKSRNFEGYGDAAVRHMLCEITETQSTNLQAQLSPDRVACYPDADADADAYVRIIATNANLARTVFNCVMYAFDWVDYAEPNVMRVGSQHCHFLIDTVFLGKVIAQQLITEKPVALANTNDLVAYFDGPQPRHIGKVMSTSTFASKWGVGHLYEHGLWDVPKTFGDQGRYFKPPDQQGLEQFLLMQMQMPCIHMTAKEGPRVKTSV
jgi:hypothetical protein